MRVYLRLPERRVLGWLVVLAALVPMFVGLRIADLTKPSIVLRDSTLYPTTDGLWPMTALTRPLLTDSDSPSIGSLDFGKHLYPAAE